MSNKYSQKLFDSKKESGAVAIKTASKRAIQKSVEATGDSIGNKIADKNTNAWKIISRKKTANYWWIKISIIM